MGGGERGGRGGGVGGLRNHFPVSILLIYRWLMFEGSLYSEFYRTMPMIVPKYKINNTKLSF